VGTISTDGGQKKGTVAISTTGVNSGTGGIELQDLPSLARPQDGDRVRQNVLTLISARRLAGQKRTAQEIAAQLNLSIEEAEVAVLSPIGDEIQVATPDLSRLNQNGIKTANPLAIPILGGAVVVVGGAIVLNFYISNHDIIVKATDKAGRELWQKTGDSAQNFADKYLPNIFAKSSKKSKKERSTELPSWAKGQKPNPGESAEEFAKRLLDEKYGPGEWSKGAGTEYNRIKKNIHRK
jgi:hypothetical protein